MASSPRDKAVDRLFSEAIFEREKGDVEKSIKLFCRVIDLTKDPKKLLDISNHLGLAYYHAGKYCLAKDAWSGVLADAKKLGDRDSEAVALRNLSRKELYSTESGYAQAYDNAIRAEDIAKSLRRKDIVWFKHGVFSAYNQASKTGSLANWNWIEVDDYHNVLKGIARREFGELLKVWLFKPSEKQKGKWKENGKEGKKQRKEALAMHRLQISVWLAGALMDCAVAYEGVSKPFLLMGRFVARMLKLKRREEQISKLLSEMK